MLKNWWKLDYIIDRLILSPFLSFFSSFFFFLFFLFFLGQQSTLSSLRSSKKNCSIKNFFLCYQSSRYKYLQQLRLEWTTNRVCEWKKFPPPRFGQGSLHYVFFLFFFFSFFFWFFFPFFFVLFFHSSTRSEYLLKCAITRISSMYIYIYILCIYILEIDSAAGILVAALPLSLFLFDRFVRLLLSYIRFITIFVWKRESRRTRERRTLLSVCFSLSIASFIHKTRLFIFFRHLKRYV